VAQMQPYYEARGLSRWELAGKQIPPLVTQIADGENGGVMMNEFPGKYFEVMRECSGSDTPAMNVTEYLEHLAAEGVGEIDLPPLQPLFQKRIWDRCWFGLRPKLEDEGITPSLTFATDIAGDVSGGKNQGVTYADNLGLDLLFDLDKLVGLKGVAPCIHVATIGNQLVQGIRR